MAERVQPEAWEAPAPFGPKTGVLHNGILQHFAPE